MDFEKALPQIKKVIPADEFSKLFSDIKVSPDFKEHFDAYADRSLLVPDAEKSKEAESTEPTR